MSPQQLALVLALVADGVAARLGEAARKIEALTADVTRLEHELAELRTKPAA